MIGLSLITAGKSKTFALARKLDNTMQIRRNYRIGKVYLQRKWNSGCQKYPLLRKIDTGWGIYKKPVNEMLDSYNNNKDNGRIRALGSVFKDNGVGTPLGGIVGAIAGTPIPFLGASFFTGALGCHIGRAVETGAQTAVKAAKKAIDVLK